MSCERGLLFVYVRPFGWIGVTCGAFSSVWNGAEAPVAMSLEKQRVTHFVLLNTFVGFDWDWGAIYFNHVLRMIILFYKKRTHLKLIWKEEKVKKLIWTESGHWCRQRRDTEASRGRAELRVPGRAGHVRHAHLWTGGRARPQAASITAASVVRPVVVFGGRTVEKITELIYRLLPDVWIRRPSPCASSTRRKSERSPCWWCGV